MKERPILFQGAMVRALLAGTKTQTRRAVKPQPWASCCIEEGMEGETPFVYSALGGDGPGHDVHETRTPCRCPYGEPGDRLWVRESCWVYGQWHADGTTKSGRCRWRFKPIGQRVRFDNPGHENCAHWGRGPGWSHRPSIHMPRWASRIMLEIAGVRVERLQAISEADCFAEGIDPESNDFSALFADMERHELAGGIAAAKAVYTRLWESINGAGSWDANPWVWVVEFRRLTP